MTNKVLGASTTNGFLGVSPDWANISCPNGRTLQSILTNGTVQYWKVETTQQTGGELLADGNYANPVSVAGNGLDNANAIKAILVSQGLSGEYGYFSDGFTLNDPLDVGIDASYQFWKYVGAETLPYSVPQGTDPSTGDWELIEFNSAAYQINENGGSVQDFIDSSAHRFGTVVELAAAELPVGTSVIINERDNAIFTIESGGVTNQYDIINAGGGNTAVLSKNQRLTAEMFGVLTYPTDTTGAIKRVFEYADHHIYPVFKAEKYIFSDTAAQVRDRIGIVGTKMPEAATTTKELKNGTIFVGTLNLRVRAFFGSNFGVDRGLLHFPNEGDAENALKIQSGTPSGAGTVIMENVVGFCREENDPYHAVLVEGYSDVSMKTVRGYYSFFGLALKAVRANIDDLSLFFNGSDNLIIKSDSAFGNCRDINISNIVCVGSSGNTNYNVRVNSFDAQMQRVNISNYNLSTANNSNIYLDVNGSTGVAINEVNIKNGVMREANVDAVLVNGNVYSTTISGKSVNQNGRHLRVIGGAQQVNLDDFFGSLSSSSTNIDDSILIESTTVNTSFNNVTSLVNYSNTNLGGITYNNTPEKNKLGVVKANIFQNNPYDDGLKTDTISGSAQTITPIFGGNAMTCFIKVKTGGVDADISTIVRTLNGTTQRFPAGFRLTVLNDDVATLTMNHNPAGNIFNQGSVGIVLPSNGLITYVFSGALWYSV